MKQIVVIICCTKIQIGCTKIVILRSVEPIQQGGWKTWQEMEERLGFQRKYFKTFIWIIYFQSLVSWFWGDLLESVCMFFVCFVVWDLFQCFRLFCCLRFISVLDKDWCQQNLQNFWEKIAVKDQLEPKYKYVAPKFNDIQWNNIIVRKSTKKIFFNLHIHEI